MSMTVWTEDWFEPGPNSPSIPLSRWSPYGITPTYNGSGDPFSVGGTAYAGWVAKFSSDAANPSQAFRLPQNGGGSGSTLDECRWYAQFLLHPPRSGQTRFEIGPYSGTRAWFDYSSGSWKAGVYSSVDLGTGVGPWVVEVAYVAGSIPAPGASGNVSWQVWLRINGVLVEDGRALPASSESNTTAYGIKAPLFNALSGTSDGFCVSSLYARYGVTAADAQAIFHRTEAWTPIHPRETLLSTVSGMAPGLIDGNGVRQIPIVPTSGYKLPTSLQAHKGLRLRGIFTGCNVPSHPSGDFLFSYLYIRSAAAGGTEVTPASGTSSLSSSSLPDKARYTGTFDISISAETYPLDPTQCIPDISGSLTITVEGGGTHALPYTYHGAGYPVCTWVDFLAAWVQLTAGSIGSKSHIFQMEEVHVSEWLTVTPPPHPTIHAPAITAIGPQLVVITSASGVVHYTLDGSTPSAESPVYSRPIYLPTTTTIKAIAVDVIVSEESQATITISGAKVAPIPSYTEHVLPYLLEQYKGDNP